MSDVIVSAPAAVTSEDRSSPYLGKFGSRISLSSVMG
jgi:hypothetical protein